MRGSPCTQKVYLLGGRSGGPAAAAPAPRTPTAPRSRRASPPHPPTPPRPRRASQAHLPRGAGARAAHGGQHRHRQRHADAGGHQLRRAAVPAAAADQQPQEEHQKGGLLDHQQHHRGWGARSARVRACVACGPPPLRAPPPCARAPLLLGGCSSPQRACVLARSASWPAAGTSPPPTPTPNPAPHPGPQPPPLRPPTPPTTPPRPPGTKEQIQNVLEAGIAAPLVYLLQNAEFDIKKEAAW
jgi:hypothetical protein